MRPSSYSGENTKLRRHPVGSPANDVTNVALLVSALVRDRLTVDEFRNEISRLSPYERILFLECLKNVSTNHENRMNTLW